MNAHRFLFYLLLFLLPTQLALHFFIPQTFVNGVRVDYLAPTLYLTDILISAIVLSWLSSVILSTSTRGRRIWKFSKAWDNSQILRRVLLRMTNLWAIGILSTVINILFATSPLIAFFKWLKITEALFLFFYIIKTKPNVKTSFFFLIGGGVYSSLLAWGQFIQQHSVGGIFYWIGERTFSISTPGIARTVINGRLFLRPYATFPHPNVLAGYLTALLPAIFIVPRGMRLALALLFLLTILITFSQSAWIIALLVLLFLLVKNKTMRIISIAVLVVGLPLFARLEGIPFIETESYQQRIKLMDSSFGMIKDHPITGVGLNNFIIELPKYQKINSYQDLQPVHNIYLLLLSELGIAGTLLFALFLFFKFRTYRFNFKNSNIQLQTSIVSLLVLGLVDHYVLTLQQALLLLAILLGFIFKEAVIQSKLPKKRT